MVTEQFTALDDSCGLFSLLQPYSFTADSWGKFADCYSLQGSQPLPPGCALRVEQNHVVGDRTVSRNQITVGPDSVAFCHFEQAVGEVRLRWAVQDVRRGASNRAASDPLTTRIAAWFQCCVMRRAPCRSRIGPAAQAGVRIKECDDA